LEIRSADTHFLKDDIMVDKKTQKIDVEKVIAHWLTTSGDDFNTMGKLYDAGSYHWALFLGHISLEKLLKGYYVKHREKHAPTIHNLYRLAELADIELSEQYSDWLDTITSFNINARYDNYKREFYDLCTQEYTEAWINRIMELRQWIKTTL